MKLYEFGYTKGASEKIMGTCNEVDYLVKKPEIDYANRIEKENSSSQVWFIREVKNG